MANCILNMSRRNFRNFCSDPPFHNQIFSCRILDYKNVFWISRFFDDLRLGCKEVPYHRKWDHELLPLWPSLKWMMICCIRTCQEGKRIFCCLRYFWRTCASLSRLAYHISLGISHFLFSNYLHSLCSKLFGNYCTLWARRELSCRLSTKNSCHGRLEVLLNSFFVLPHH